MLRFIFRVQVLAGNSRVEEVSFPPPAILICAARVG